MKIFNPEHDMCLAAGDVNFIPPAAVLEFADKCRWIEKYMYELPGEAITPWGWNQVLRNTLRREGLQIAFEGDASGDYPSVGPSNVAPGKATSGSGGAIGSALRSGYTISPSEIDGMLPTDEELHFILDNSRRELALELHRFVYDKVGLGGGILPPDYRVAAVTFTQIEDAVERWGAVVLKSPLSGSGKGVRFVTGALSQSDAGWCSRVLQRQGSVVVEQRKGLGLEFALLFECAGELKFLGYSLFYAKNGAYGGNILASNKFIAREVSKYIFPLSLEEVRCAVEEFLRSRLQGRYKGYVGVDCFWSSDGLNPAMEINLRMTMGHVARNIFDNYREEFSLGEATHKFEPEKGVEPNS